MQQPDHAGKAVDQTGTVHSAERGIQPHGVIQAGVGSLFNSFLDPSAQRLQGKQAGREKTLKKLCRRSLPTAREVTTILFVELLSLGWLVLCDVPGEFGTFRGSLFGYLLERMVG